MSNTDSFIEEVTEKVRNDKLFALFRKYGWIAGLAVIAMVGGTAWSEWNKSNARAAAQAQGDALLDAIDAGDPAALATAAADFPDSVVAQLLGADANGLTAIAANADLPAYQRDLARLKLAIMPDAMPADQAIETLRALSQPGQPYAGPATEFLALRLLAASDRAGALDIMQARIVDASATPTQVRRLVELIVALGETPQLAAGLSADTQN